MSAFTFTVHNLLLPRGQNTSCKVYAIPPWVGAIEYQPKGGDAPRLGTKDRYGSCVGGR